MKRINTQLLIEGWGKLGPAIIYMPNTVGVEKLPMIVFLHGGGESAQNPNGLDAVNTWGLPNQIANKGLELPAVVVCPQAAASSHQFNATRWIILDMLKKYPQVIDPDSIHLTGISYGGGGVWSTVTNPGVPNPENPIVQLISTIVPVSSMGVMQTYEDPFVKDVAAKGVAVWGICGSNDNHYGVQVDYVKRVGANNPLGLSVRMTAVNGADHNPSGWEPAYDGTVRSNGQNIYEWMFANARNKRNVVVPAPTPVPPQKKLIGTATIKSYDDATFELIKQ